MKMHKGNTNVIVVWLYNGCTIQPARAILMLQGGYSSRTLGSKRGGEGAGGEPMENLLFKRHCLSCWYDCHPNTGWNDSGKLPFLLGSLHIRASGAVAVGHFHF